MTKYNIARRSISDAVYLKNNPNGDPFEFIFPRTKKDIMLYGMGLGLYWGEGTKSNKQSVRIGNSDPKLIETFIIFLEKIFSIRKMDLRFSLQIFSDTNPAQSLKYWISSLKVHKSQFTKPTISISNKKGTYKKKCVHGVVTLYYHNRKLRDLLMKLLCKVRM